MKSATSQTHDVGGVPETAGSAGFAMRKRFRAASLWLIVILVFAFALRVGFARNYARHASRQALSVIPFLFEPGNIAYSLAAGNGFSSPHRVDDAGLSRAAGGDLPALRSLLLSVLRCRSRAEYPVCHPDLHSSIPGRHTPGRYGGGRSGRRTVGCFPQRDTDSGRKPLGRVAFRAARGNHLLGYAGARRFRALARLVRLRSAVGPGADDQSDAGLLAALPARMADLSRPSREAWDQKSGAGHGTCDPVLCAVDDSQLRRVSQVGPTALRLRPFVVAWEQRTHARPAAGRATPHQ